MPKSALRKDKWTLSFDPGLISAFLAMLNSALGGGSAPYTITVLHDIAAPVNGAFAGGSPSPFAQDHLFNGACP